MLLLVGNIQTFNKYAPDIRGWKNKNRNNLERERNGPFYLVEYFAGLERDDRETNEQPNPLGRFRARVVRRLSHALHENLVSQLFAADSGADNRLDDLHFVVLFHVSSGVLAEVLNDVICVTIAV